MIKPNEAEISELLGKPIITVSEGAAAAMELVNQGVDNVLLSMGDERPNLGKPEAGAPINPSNPKAC